MVREQTRRFAVACLAAAVVVLVDQATKAAALGGLSQEERIPLLGDLLGLQLAFNPGAILSLGAGVTGLLTLLGVGAVVLLVVAAARARTGWWAMGIGLILGGAIGNLIDRLFSLGSGSGTSPTSSPTGTCSSATSPTSPSVPASSSSA